MTATFNPSGFSAFLIGDESLTIACGDMILAGGHRITCVVTRDAAVRDWAVTNNLPVLDAPRDLVGASHSADWLLSIANLRMIPQDVLSIPSKGAINFHDGPLPRYAGLNTPAWAIINKEATHGVSWHVIEGGVDEGDLLAQRSIDISQDETAFSLNSKCYAAGMESFATVMAQLESDTLQLQQQDLSLRSYFAKDQRPVGMGVLDFHKYVDDLSALVRGLDFGGYANPLTLPKVALAEQRFLAIGSLDVIEGSGVPGTVLSVSENELVVATPRGAVRLTDLKSLTGERVDLRQTVSEGEVLPRIAPSDLDVRNEDRYLRILSEAGPLSLPLIDTDVDAENDAVLKIDLPQSSSPQRLASVAALSLLGGTNVSEGYVALYKPASHPLLAEWVPCKIAALAGDVADQALTRLEAQLMRAHEGPSMALDLVQRDPAIADRQTPQVAISFEDVAVPGAVLTVCPQGEALVMRYQVGKLSESAVNLLAERIQSAVQAAASADTCADLWSLPQRECDLQLKTWNDTSRDYNRQTIHAAFEAQAVKTPDADALVFEDQTLSYSALNAKANRVAHRLRELGAAPGTPIGIYTTRSVDLMVGVLGILKAGGAYVPLDPAYPADRIAHYISDSAAPLIVTQRGLVAQLPENDAKVLELDADENLQASSDENPAHTATADDLAYLIYTSGSTGVPKGVMVSHGNVANFFAGMDDRIDHADGSVWLAVTSLSFDISVLELFWTLARGFKVVLAGDESRTLISNGPIAVSDRTIDFNLFYWGNDDGVGPKKYELLLEGAKFADAHGFNAVWTPERHFHAFGGPYPNPSVTGAAVAAVTQNLDVRAGSCVAPLHHPARIAEEWAVIDNLTNGRVGLAIASGWQPDDFVLRPENTPPENKPAMYDAIKQLRQLWRGDAVAFPTKDGTPFEVVTQPRPVSTKLPIWVTTAGNPQTWKEAGEIGANVLTHLLGQSVDEVADKIKIYHAALRDAGHDPRDFKVTVMLHTYLAETRQVAEEIARGPMKDYLRSAAGLIKQYAWAFPAFKKPEGATSPFEVDLEGLSQEEMDAILEFAFQRYFNDSGLFGTVADGVARAEQLKRIGVDEIACLIDYGIPTQMVMEGLKPLADVLVQSNQGTALADDDFSLAAQILRHDVSHMQCTPSMVQMLVTNAEAQMALGRIDHLMVGGEALPGNLATALKSYLGGDLQNMYGPTETTIWSTTQMVDETAAVAIPIGTPIANTDCFILNSNMEPQPVGKEGELWIGGAGVTLGYWQRETMTAERFVPNPFGDGRLYRTGDLAAWDAEGCLHFSGRADAQVKIRGHRIELGEIEARLAVMPGVTQAVVIAREAPGGAQLVGYVTGDGISNADALLRRLADDLPAIMVPSALVVLDKMPLTPNKKVDRKALPAPQSRAKLPAEAVTHKSDTQAAIAKVWSALLGIQDVRGGDNFFALGGHSLLAVQAHRDIKTALGAEKLSITDIFRFPTLEGLAGHIEKAPGSTPVAQVQPPAADRTEVMSKRRAMRAGRSRAGA